MEIPLESTRILLIWKQSRMKATEFSSESLKNDKMMKMRCVNKWKLDLLVGGKPISFEHWLLIEEGQT